MAEQGTVELGVATGTDYAAHLHTYTSFLKLVKYRRVRNRHPPHPVGILLRVTS